MDPLWNRYYKLNRIFLSPVGLWPHGNRKLKPIQAVVSVVILVSSVVTQLLKLFTTEYDFDFVLTDLSYSIPSMVYVVKYKTFYSQANRLIRMMELIQEDWNSLTSEEEIHIIQKNTNTGRRYIIVFTCKKTGSV
ncbi:hypothetical protein EAI_13889 [Harpegnathos saltator]|uniref:Uncharacterized protein n=1 Tax=Harpegnathos saltator TaxID=610380 RepID=E2C2G3_HARSA|nr:hypothetical protein EAI_13889 [Harpegnathos saltator]